MQGEVPDYQEEQGFPKELHEGGGQEVATSGYGASQDVGSTCSVRRQMATAAGKKSTTSL